MAFAYGRCPPKEKSGLTAAKSAAMLPADTVRMEVFSSRPPDRRPSPRACPVEALFQRPKQP